MRLSKIPSFDVTNKSNIIIITTNDQGATPLLSYHTNAKKQSWRQLTQQKTNEATNKRI